MTAHELETDAFARLRASYGGDPQRVLDDPEAIEQDRQHARNALRNTAILEEMFADPTSMYNRLRRVRNSFRPNP